MKKVNANYKREQEKRIEKEKKDLLERIERAIRKREYTSAAELKYEYDCLCEGRDYVGSRQINWRDV